MKKISFKPISGKLILKKIDKSEHSAGGIIIPDIVRESYSKNESALAEVLAVGPGMDENRFHPNGGMECRVGDQVVYPSNQGFSFKIDNQEFLSLYENFVQAVIIKD